MTMPQTLTLSGLTLRVKNLEAQLAFYRDLMGLEIIKTENNRTELAPAGRKFTLTLVHQPTAPLRPQPSLGLYHFALLLPDRKSLASLFKRLVEARYHSWDGASDHLVSEALYLRDPEGNGIELYRDRPRSQWPYQGEKLAMGSQQLDLEQLLSEAPQATPIDPATTFGHLHLHVANLDEAEQFFSKLGLEVTQGDYPGARFLAADGYHHHIGTNLWARGRSAPAESTGLIEYSIAIHHHPDQTLTDPNGATVHITAL